jgi:hypothetical protein
MSVAAQLLAGPPLAAIATGSVALLVAVLSALYAMAPTVYEVAGIDAIENLTQEQFWNGPRSIGSRRTAEVRARELRAARIANARKVRRLVVALSSEVFGILALGAVGLFALFAAAQP